MNNKDFKYWLTCLNDTQLAYEFIQEADKLKELSFLNVQYKANRKEANKIIQKIQNINIELNKRSKTK